jgi:uncharacterized membrane protein (UPF0127 family)
MTAAQVDFEGQRPALIIARPAGLGNRSQKLTRAEDLRHNATFADMGLFDNAGIQPAWVSTNILPSPSGWAFMNRAVGPDGIASRAQKTMAVLLALIFTVVAFALAGCDKDADAPAPAPVKTASDYFTINVGAEPVRMQLAIEQPNNMREMARGLMGRRDLAEDQGMIFVYRNAKRVSFWMRNTPTPLDIGFFTKDGVLTEVRQMFPFDETSVPSARDDIQFALEMNQGWFARRSVHAGAQLDLNALAAALKARGFDPADYGIR